MYTTFSPAIRGGKPTSHAYLTRLGTSPLAPPNTLFQLAPTRSDSVMNGGELCALSSRSAVILNEVGRRSSHLPEVIICARQRVVCGIRAIPWPVVSLLLPPITLDAAICRPDPGF